MIRLSLLACLAGTALMMPLCAHSQEIPEPDPIQAPATTGVMAVPAGTIPPASTNTTATATPAAPVAPVADPLAGNVLPNQQSILSTTPNDGRVPPPAPGGGVMDNGQIPPISAELLALTPEEQQEIAVSQARGKAFDGTLRQAMPLEPNEIKTVIDRYEETTKAVEQPFAGKIPTPEVRVETISLEPSSLPPVIHLAPGHVTSLTILDATGQPWPVADVSWGGDFEIQSPPDGGHIIRISPLGGYKVGNISLRLMDLPTPVTFSLQTQPDTVDYRFDARIPLRGPNALQEIIDTPYTTEAGDGSMMMVLDGTPPDGATALSVTGVDPRTSAYKLGAKVYVRTPFTMLSPAWSEQSSSSDGMKVYVIPESPVLLLSDQGKMVRANLAINSGNSLDAAFESQNSAGETERAAMAEELTKKDETAPAQEGAVQ